MAHSSFDKATTCGSRRHRGQPRPEVLPGLQICRRCRDRLENDLIGLPAWYEGYGQPRGVRDAVVQVRSDILSTMATWCGLVADQRGVVAPNQLDIRALATFLVIHFTWLTAHPAAPALVDQLADLTEAIGTVVLPGREREQH